MKNIVINDDYRECDLKPPMELVEYLALTEKDVRQFFSPARLRECASPGADGVKGIPVFQKFGMKYHQCPNSQMLYVSPRPSDEDLVRFYREAPSGKFWREELSKAANQKRKEKILKPRLQWIVDTTQEYLPEAKHWVDINVSQYSYVEEIIQSEFFPKKTIINSLIDPQNFSQDSNLKIISEPWWVAAPGQPADIVSLFEVADRTADVPALFKQVSDLTRKGGLVFLTGFLASGLDVQILWDKFIHLFPPDRLNLFTLEAIRHLARKHSFDCLEFSTPGILDVSRIEEAVTSDASVEIPRFVRYLLAHRDGNVKNAFQEFLQASQLSSYGRMVLRKI